MAGYFQNRYPNPCRFSPNGYFGSKFVTVCVTGKSILLHNIYSFCFKDIRLIKKFIPCVILGHELHSINFLINLIMYSNNISFEYYEISATNAMQN